MEVTESFPARLTARRDAGAGMTVIVLEPPAEVARRYERPGQYVWIEPGGYFVLASPPRDRRWELVIRPAGEAAEHLIAAPIGSSLSASGPLGQGFPAVRGGPLVMAATGGAIAAVRAVVEERARAGDAARTLVFLGVARARDVPLREATQAWSSSGVDLVICTSQEDGPHAGRVQDIARARLAHAAAGTPLFLVGHAGMVAAMQELAREKELTAHVNV